MFLSAGPPETSRSGGRPALVCWLWRGITGLCNAGNQRIIEKGQGNYQIIFTYLPGNSGTLYSVILWTQRIKTVLSMHRKHERNSQRPNTDLYEHNIPKCVK